MAFGSCIRGKLGPPHLLLLLLLLVPFQLLNVTVRRTALLGLSYSTVTEVVLLDLDQLGPQFVRDFRWMRIPRTVIRFVGPYSDGVGLNTLADSVVTELSL
jgi:hypothetical protein